ncbi:HD domain-containing protein [Boudabousia marimammalium]|uniref:HD domain-containing protein n=1 Tax=Boudabousia marimammalium TaxID=156892 RepID=A0A1Q5PJ78_9ACTO|nr:hypothetical protein [Boudabousia marimammalium]OKL45919.1 hypothetical protein BM477_07905 [Boudabousia marimammalium]
MGISDAPQWLVSAFIRSAEAVEATADKEILREHCLKLVERWSAPERVFHNLTHLINTLAALDEIVAASHDPEMLRLATWYHGAVFATDEDSTYAGEAGEVMAPSAQYAADDLRELGVSEERIQRIVHLILGLGKHSAAPEDIDARVLVDAELSMLAASPQDYRKYREAIAAEYSHIPRARFLAGRKMIITHLLERPKLFISPLGAAWEKPARENLEAELTKVNAELSKLSEAELTELRESNQLDTAADEPRETGAAPDATPTLIKGVKEPSTDSGKIPEVEVAPLGISDPNEIAGGIEEPELAEQLDEYVEESPQQPATEIEEKPELVEPVQQVRLSAETAQGDSVPVKRPILHNTDDEDDLLSTISSTLEVADDCLDTAEMRALKEAKRRNPIVPKMTNPDLDPEKNQD